MVVSQFPSILNWWALEFQVFVFSGVLQAKVLQHNHPTWGQGNGYRHGTSKSQGWDDPHEHQGTGGHLGGSRLGSPPFPSHLEPWNGHLEGVPQPYIRGCTNHGSKNHLYTKWDDPPSRLLTGRISSHSHDGSMGRTVYFAMFKNVNQPNVVH